MMKVLRFGLLGVLALAVAATVLQHLHYASIRKTAAQDRQDIFHSSTVFHVLTFVGSDSEADLLVGLRALRAATGAGGKWIYAGKVVVNVPSGQIGPIEWSAVTLVQYASRAAYEEVVAREQYREALSRFSQTYQHGMKRDTVRNLFVPQGLLLRKWIQTIRLMPSPYPFEPAPASMLPPRGGEMLARLRGAGDLGAKAVVIVNLQKRGTPEQAAADARYVSPMINLMARRGYGPIHVGAAIPLPGSLEFDSVAIVYYPGAPYFADMFASTFYQGIMRNKQLADNQSTITVPILDLLDPK